MIKVYADNASTTFPKPKEVSEAVFKYLTEVGSNVSRGNYESSYSAGRIVYETRELLCKFFNFNNPLNVVFTSNITESLNIIIKGLLNKGDHVITTSMEHNAIIRPLNSMKSRGVEVSQVPCNNDGSLCAKDIEGFIKKNTKLILVTHVSNVCGTILPIKEISDICKKYNIYFIIDSAQSAGVLSIDFKDLGLSALPFTGHKGLLGPQGIGGLIISDEIVEKISAFKEGGTGSFSQEETQPHIMPDKFESGTLNIPGIYGLYEGIKFIERQGVSNILKYEKELNELFINYICNIENVTLHGVTDLQKRTSVFSLTFKNLDAAEASYLLDKEFGIMTRAGLHCSPAAHKTLGTFPEGTVRFSFGFFNKREEIDYIANCIRKIVKNIN